MLTMIILNKSSEFNVTHQARCYQFVLSVDSEQSKMISYRGEQEYLDKNLTVTVKKACYSMEQMDSVIMAMRVTLNN